MKKFLIGALLVLVCIPLGGCTWLAEKVTEEIAESQTGEDVDIDYDNDGGVEITTDEGEWAAGSKASIPDDFPSDIPVVDYNAVVSSSSFSDENDGTKSFTVMVESKKSLTDTKDYYQTSMLDEGWTSDSTFESEGTIMLSYTKGENNCAVWIAEDDGKVNVTLTVTINS